MQCQEMDSIILVDPFPLRVSCGPYTAQNNPRDLRQSRALGQHTEVQSSGLVMLQGILLQEYGAGGSFLLGKIHICFLSSCY